jgi:hypothetical protein
MSNTDTHITLILDRSGSMHDIQDDIIGGVNAFFAKQAALERTITATLVQFDGHDPFEVLAANLPVVEVKPLTRETYQPRGNTPLLDAVGGGIHSLEKRLESLDEAVRPGGIVFVVVTDGCENASRRFSKAHITDLIKAKTDAGWEFVFLSSDLSAVQEAQDIQFESRKSARYSKSRTRESIDIVAGKVAEFSLSRHTVQFSDKDRQEIDDQS